jgi:hypothetical protein
MTLGNSSSSLSNRLSRTGFLFIIVPVVLKVVRHPFLLARDALL